VARKSGSFFPKFATSNRKKMKKKETTEQLKLQTEKQHLILKLRLAMETNRHDLVKELALDLQNINSKTKCYV